ncbi:MAG: peptide/nickel transport system substrate-binding protein [Thermomicrobiales bacterium]|jgi:peptide/nickel transport system substrate-binding protein|nr:peptide/nickel transport system substrate-binding protein [Thermomicrobiales bacterium]
MTEDQKDPNVTVSEDGQPRVTRRQVVKAGAGVGAAAAGVGGFALGARRGNKSASAAGGGNRARELREARQNANVIVAGWEQDVGTLDPAKTICGHETRVVTQFAKTLWGLEGSSPENVGMLAESWEIAADGLSVSVKLKPNLTFQDGTPVDATAVKWSFDRFLDANHPFYDPPYNLLSYYLGGPDIDRGLATVEVIDPLSLKFTLKAPEPLIESYMSLPYAAVVSPTAVQAAGNAAFGEKPIGTGPFQVSSWEKGVRIVLDRNDTYYGEKAKVDQLIIRPIVESAARLTALQQGEVDFIVAMSPEFIPVIQGDPNLQLLQAPGYHIWWIGLNVHVPPLENVKVRQALNYAVDKQAIVDTILQGAATLTNGPIIAHSWANDPTVEPYPYDPERAKALLAEAGHPDGFSVKFWVPESGSGMVAPKEIGQIVQADLEKIGVTAEIVTQEWVSYVEDWQNKGLDAGGYGLAEMSWNFSSTDPGEWLEPNVLTNAHPPGGGFNGSFYSNPQVDDLLAKAKATLNQDERATYFKQAQAVMREDCPWIFMFSANNIAAATARLKGIELSSDPGVVSFERGYYE